jgi:hypothetical protein
MLARAATSWESSEVRFAERTSARISDSSDGAGSGEREESGVVVLEQVIHEVAFFAYAPPVCRAN